MYKALFVYVVSFPFSSNSLELHLLSYVTINVWEEEEKEEREEEEID